MNLNNPQVSDHPAAHFRWERTHTSTPTCSPTCSTSATFGTTRCCAPASRFAPASPTHQPWRSHMIEGTAEPCAPGHAARRARGAAGRLRAASCQAHSRTVRVHRGETGRERSGSGSPLARLLLMRTRATADRADCRAGEFRYPAVPQPSRWPLRTLTTPSPHRRCRVAVGSTRTNLPPWTWTNCAQSLSCLPPMFAGASSPPPV